ncbi:DoxX-like family protein [Pseudoalteromonas sp. BZB3]|uniref:DoxX-like family protein n=1 Tax=Pseudoalteromonas sp. BZB3 TaxID=3136670 RepID=UPI0032C47243
MTTVQMARYMITFVWLYHGIFPKLVHVAPLEQLMTGSIGFSDDISYLITKAAGIGEVIFGLLFFVFYKTKLMNILNILALAFLLLSVVMLQPQLLIEAFNPVTTNLPIMVFSFVLLSEIKQGKL